MILPVQFLKRVFEIIKKNFINFFFIISILLRIHSERFGTENVI
jgi:hypothetical protein